MLCDHARQMAQHSASKLLLVRIDPHRPAAYTSEHLQRMGMSRRTVVGPLFSHGGFQSWYWVCTSTELVAVPMGLWHALRANRTATLFLGSTVAGVTGVSAKQARPGVSARLARLPEVKLRGGKGHLHWTLNHIAAIRFARKASSSAELTIVARDGERRAFGIMNVGDQSAIVDALRLIYGPRVMTR
jgi:hypothetical protein